MCVWDWLLQIADECEMVQKTRTRSSHISNAVYFAGRWVMILPTENIQYWLAALKVLLRLHTFWVISSYKARYKILFNDRNLWWHNLIADGLVRYCDTTSKFAAAVNIFAVPTISFLFFLRVTAVYLHNKVIITFFGVLWFGVLSLFVLDSTTMFSFDFIDEKHSRPCSLAGRTIDAWAYVASAIFDTLVFLAISWRLASTSMTSNASFRDRLKSFVRGEGLLDLSKALLHSGQLYYMWVSGLVPCHTDWIVPCSTTIGFSIVTVITTLAPGVRNDWWGLLIYPNIAIQSIMACRLFRELKLRVIVDSLDDDIDIPTAIVFASSASTSSHIDEFHSSGTIPKDTGEILDESNDAHQLTRDASKV